MIDHRNASTAVEIRHFHLFCGLGGGAKGFNSASPRVGNLRARFRCLGGIDVDVAAVRDFGLLAGVPGTLLDLFDRDQYRASRVLSARTKRLTQRAGADLRATQPRIKCRIRPANLRTKFEGGAIPRNTEVNLSLFTDEPTQCRACTI